MTVRLKTSIIRTVALLATSLVAANCIAVVDEGGPLGLVLAGGGAKGAYEVGVWQTLVEMGVSKRIVAISGTSVGAINAALFAAADEPGRCTALWEGEVGGIFRFNTNLVVKTCGEDGVAKIERAYAAMSNNIQADCEAEARRRGCAVSNLPQETIAHIEEMCESVARKKLFLQLPKMKTMVNMLNDFDESAPFDGFLPSSYLYSLILRELPRKWSRKAPATYATSLKKGSGGNVFSAIRFRIDKESPERRAAMICASACIPFIFGVYGIDGDVYVDGGFESKGGDNVPLAPILENHPEITTVIIVYLDHAEDSLTKKRVARNEAVAEKAGVTLITITPSKSIGCLFGWSGVFDASPETARKLIELGRKDAREALLKAGLTKGVSESTAPFVK